MKSLIVISLGIIFFCSFQSCKKRGCTISYAANYDATAKKDNKTCEFYYKAQISMIKILDFPDLDPNGDYWDSGNDPDLYIRYTNEEDDIKYQTILISEVGPDDTVSWNIPTFVAVDTIEPNTQFKVYEVDEQTTELIEKFPVNFLDYMHESQSGLVKYPDSILFTGNSVVMTVYLNWVE